MLKDTVHPRVSLEKRHGRSRSDPHGRQERSEAFLSIGMDQEEADDKHHRAGYTMN